MNKIIGVDVGYGWTKVSDGIDIATFPSTIGPAVTIKFKNELSRNGHYREIEVDGHAWFVGELARKQSLFTPQAMARERDLDIVRVLVLSALFELHSTEDDIDLVTGLPVAWFVDKDELASVLQGTHHYKANGKPRTVNIETVHVVPQPFGSLCTQLLDRAGRFTDPLNLKQEKVAVLDIGTYTTDCVLFDALEYIEPQSGSIPTAMNAALQLLGNKVTERYNVDLTVPELERAYRDTTFLLLGNKINLKPMIQAVNADVGQAIMSQAKSLWGAGKTIAAVFVTGGGASSFYPQLRMLYPQARLITDAQTANANGFQRFGLLKQGV